MRVGEFAGWLQASRRAVVGVASLVALWSPRAGQTQAPLRDDRCGRGTWSSPRELRTERNEAAYVEAPQLVPARAGLLLIGFPTIVSSDLADSVRYLVGVSERQAAGLILQRDGRVRTIPLPDGFRHLLYPRAVSDGRGGAHVVWGTAADPAASVPLVDTLWYARFDGAHWDRPEVVETELPVRWSSIGPSSLILRGDRLYASVPGRRSGSSAAVFVFIRSGGRWRTTTLVIGPAEVAYSALAWVRGSLILATIAADISSPAPDHNSVFVQVSADEGATWTMPRLLRRSGSAGAFDPALLLSKGDSARLVWAQQREGSAVTQIVAMRVTGDAGATWHAVADFDPGAPFDGLSAVTLPSGDLVWIARSDAGTLMEGRYHASWSWGTLPVEAIAGPSLARVGRDSVVLVTGTLRTRPTGRVPLSFIMCRRR